MNQQTHTMADSTPFRLVKGGAIIGVGTRADCERMQAESGGEIVMFDRPANFVRIK